MRDLNDALHDARMFLLGLQQRALTRSPTKGIIIRRCRTHFANTARVKATTIYYCSRGVAVARNLYEFMLNSRVIEGVHTLHIVHTARLA